MIATTMLVLLITLPSLGQSESQADSTEISQQVETRESALDDLRELSELDLIGELIPRGRKWIADGALLADSGEARAIVAHALHAAGAEAEAFQVLLCAELPVAEQVWLEFERARIHLKMDELENALAILTFPGESDAAETQRKLRHPDHVDSWLLVARTYARAGDMRRAAPAAQEFLRRAPLHPGAPIAWHLLATASLEVRDAEKAERCLERGRALQKWHTIFRARRIQLRRTPNEPLPRLGIGLAWMQVEAYDRARGEFEILVAQFPAYSRGWFHLGEALRLSKNIDGAYAAYGRALETDSSQHLARFNLAIIDLQSGRDAEAQAAFELLISVPEVESDPRFADTHRHLSDFYSAAGDSERSRAHLARYRELRALNQ